MEKNKSRLMLKLIQAVLGYGSQMKYVAQLQIYAKVNQVINLIIIMEMVKCMGILLQVRLSIQIILKLIRCPMV